MDELQSLPAPALKLGVLTFLLASITALGPLSMDMYLPALPAMGGQLHASPGDVQLTIAVYVFANGLGQMIFGPLSDRFGRRLPAIGGILLYVMACVGCAMSMNIGWLIGLRFFQALGVCVGQVIARAILADLFEPRDMARFSSMLSSISMIAPIIAPLAGGYIFTAFGWRPIFLTLAGYGLTVLAAVVLRLPETRAAEAQAASRRELPLLSYMAVVRNWPLMQMGLAGAFGNCAFVTYLGSAPHLLIEHYGIPAGQFAWYFAANSVGVIIGANLNRHFLRRRLPDAVLRWSCLAYVVTSLAVVIATNIPGVSKWGVLIPLFFVITTFPMVASNAMAIAQGLDRTRGGSVAAVCGGLQAVAGAIAVTVSAALSDGTPRAMSGVMLGAAVLSAALFLDGRKRTRMV